MMTQEQKETRLLQVGKRLSRLGKIIRLTNGQDEGLQALYDEYTDEMDSLERS